MKYKCLMLDHDDTVVDSTLNIHYNCFSEYIDKFRPELSGKYSPDEYIKKNFNPGVVEFFRDELMMDDAELAHEVEYWREYMRSHIPPAYKGVGEIIRDFRSSGGIIAVNSHSLRESILRDYEANFLPLPDVVYSIDLPEKNRKPSPYSIYDIGERYGISPSEILVVDDLKPGYLMARSAGSPIVGSGWAYDIPEINGFMKENCDFYFTSPRQLYDHLFG